MDIQYVSFAKNYRKVFNHKPLFDILISLNIFCFKNKLYTVWHASAYQIRKFEANLGFKEHLGPKVFNRFSYFASDLKFKAPFIFY